MRKFINGYKKKITMKGNDMLDHYFPMEYEYSIPLKLSEVGKYSISKPWLSKRIIQTMKQYIGPLEDKIITDSTANNGGDTLRFSKHFTLVNSIEIDKYEYEHLENNVLSYKCNNVLLYLGDCKDIIPTLVQDIIYIDPPWGGEDYRNHKKLDLYLGNTLLLDFIRTLKSKCSHCVVKIPYNFNDEQFHTLGCKYHKIELTRTVYLLIICMV